MLDKTAHNSNTTPRIIGHRGAPAKAPENTMASFNKAYEDDANMIELDVAQSSDGELVAIHYDRLELTTNGRGSVSKTPYAKLAKLDAGRGEKIPRLDDVLEWAEDKVALDLEVKHPHKYPGMEENLTGLIEKHNAEKRVVVSSLDGDFIRGFEERNPHLETAEVFFPKSTLMRGGLSAAAGGIAAGSLFAKGLIDLREAAAGVGAALVVGAKSGQEKDLERIEDSPCDWVIPQWTQVSNELVDEAQEDGKKVATWTVDNKRIARRMRNAGVDGIITNDPGGLLNI